MEGLSSLWSGLSATLALAAPATVLYFTTYDQLTKKLRSTDFFSSTSSSASSKRGRDTVVSFTSGATARTLATTVVSPLEMVRTKMQSRRMRWWQVREALRAAVSGRRGVANLWRGCWPTLMRDVPFSAMYWAGYENLKRLLLEGKEEVQEGDTDSEVRFFLASFASGATSGAAAAAATLPMDVIKTRSQGRIP